MLKTIDKIKGLGVYQDYTKPAGTPDFGIKNLIYGWNYSGKTTLSRLFAQLETKTANQDLSGCEFAFSTDNDSVTEKNFHQCGLTVRVFNSDFIRNNLHFEGGSFNPILLLGKESEEAQRKIDRFTERVKRAASARAKLNRRSGEFKTQIADAKTAAAKSIRQLLKVDPYIATHLEKDVLAVQVLGCQTLSDRELSDATELALTPDSKRPNLVAELSVSLSVAALHGEAKAILAATPSFSHTIGHLEENPAIEHWVQEGLTLHSQSGPCEFCGNELTQHRLNTLLSHFSKDLADHREKIESLLRRVQTATLSMTWPKDLELNAQFREDYKQATAPLPGAISALNRAIRVLADDIQLKLDDSRKAMTPSPLPAGIETAITDAVTAVNLVIQQNNQLAENFVSARDDARLRARYHYVQQFMEDQQSAGLELKGQQQVARAERLHSYAENLRQDIEKLQAEISQAQNGREKINARLGSMLGSEAVQINVIKDSSGQDRFQLVRKNGHVAKNLSDGERTAIAFSYFLTKLQELKASEFKDTIVYIDDPISSLDANHLFQVTAAIRAMFFTQRDKNAPWETTCKQLFVSTHNFEFFNLLREIKPVASKQGAKLFLIKRIGERASTFQSMPPSLARYQSEYHFLFEVIHQFHQAPDKTTHNVLMLLPNAMRRFVELYTYSRLPGPKDSEQVDDRAEALFGVERAKRILKIFHYFSHGNTLERFAGNNELIFDLEHAVKDLMDAIAERDKPHLDALMAALQP